jgi:hypothetical protein
MNKKLMLGVVVAAVVAGSSYASPYWTVYKMRTAIIDNDAASFSERVDFPALRENLKAQFMVKMADKMNSPELKNNPFAALGSALAVGLANQIVETMVTPTGLMFMIDSAKSKPLSAVEKPVALAPESATEQQKPAEYALSYESWSTVKAQAKSKTVDPSAVAFILKRDGLWGWKLAGIELPTM